MVKRRYSRADVGNPLEVDIGETDALFLAHVEQDLAPGVNHQAVPEGVAAVLVMADLRRQPPAITVWLSRDGRRIPLAAEVSAAFGNVRLELVTPSSPSSTP